MNRSDPTLMPLQQLEPGAWSQAVGVFTDIDDTLSDDDAITPVALAYFSISRNGVRLAQETFPQDPLSQWANAQLALAGS